MISFKWFFRVLASKLSHVWHLALFKMEKDGATKKYKPCIQIEYTYTTSKHKLLSLLNFNVSGAKHKKSNSTPNGSRYCLLLPCSCFCVMLHNYHGTWLSVPCKGEKSLHVWRHKLQWTHTQDFPLRNSGCFYLKNCSAEAQLKCEHGSCSTF